LKAATKSTAFERGEETRSNHARRAVHCACQWKSLALLFASSLSEHARFDRTVSGWTARRTLHFSEFAFIERAHPAGTCLARGPCDCGAMPTFSQHKGTVMKNLFRQLASDQRGLSTMEYAVLFVIIVVGAVGLWSELGDDLADQVDRGSTHFTETVDDHQP
jgi:Flp pilus assembly pilin Flp